MELEEDNRYGVYVQFSSAEISSWMDNSTAKNKFDVFFEVDDLKVGFTMGEFLEVLRKQKEKNESA